MLERPSEFAQSDHPPNATPSEHWHTFSEILHRLHQEGIYIHAHQLAEFMLMHGLPVDLTYVPDHLQQKADQINTNYRGDLAQLETVQELPHLFPYE
jgi:hypothetical protein